MSTAAGEPQRRGGSSGALRVWTVVAHEELSSDPVVGFRRLLAAIGLDWDPGIERRIAESDRSGSGYETSRVAFDEAKRWRSRLNADEIAAANRVIAGFEEVSRVAMTMWRASWAVRGEAGLGGA